MTPLTLKQLHALQHEGNNRLEALLLKSAIHYALKVALLEQQNTSLGTTIRNKQEEVRELREQLSDPVCDECAGVTRALEGKNAVGSSRRGARVRALYKSNAILLKAVEDAGSSVGDMNETLDDLAVGSEGPLWDCVVESGEIAALLEDTLVEVKEIT